MPEFSAEPMKVGKREFLNATIQRGADESGEERASKRHNSVWSR